MNIFTLSGLDSFKWIKPTKYECYHAFRVSVMKCTRLFLNISPYFIIVYSFDGYVSLFEEHICTRSTSYTTLTSLILFTRDVVAVN
jgi:hypothetical protein